MNVLIVNQHSSNFGDDAAGTALVQLLLKNDDVNKINIIYNASQSIPVNDKRVIHNLNIKFKSAGYINCFLYILFAPIGFKGFSFYMKEWSRIIKESDVIYIAPSGANIGIYKDWRFLFRILMIVRAGKTPIFHYNTIGKSGNFVFDKIAYYILKYSKIYVREEKTYQYIHSLNLPCVMGPDTAFALNPLIEKIDSKLISIIPSCFDNWHPNFINNPVEDKIIDELIPLIANWVKKNNFYIEILPHLRSKEEQNFNLKVKNKLQLCGCLNVVFRDDIKTMWEYDSAIAKSRIIIGMRYHAVVLSAKNYRPFISLSYENKMKEVCKYLHLEDFDVDLVTYAKTGYIDIEHVLQKALDNESIITNNLKVTIKEEILPKVTVPTDKL